MSCEPLERRRLFTSDLGFAVKIGGGSGDVANAVTTDAAGNVFIAGQFAGTVDFNPAAGVTNLTASGPSDAVVAKYSAAGALVWARELGGAKDESASGIAVDGAGNVVTTGVFSGGGPADFDPGAGSTNLTGTNAAYLWKLNPSGNLVWAKNMGSSVTAHGVVVDKAGNVYVANQLSQFTADVDPGSAVLNLKSNGNADLLIQKLSSAGNFIFAKQIGAAGNQIPNALAIDPAGNLYLTGQFTGTADFDPGSGTANLTSAGAADVLDAFVLRLNNGGNFISAQRLGGTSTDIGTSIALGGSSSYLYTVGYFMGTGDYDPSANTSNLTSAGGEDWYLSKLLI